MVLLLIGAGLAFHLSVVSGRFLPQVPPWPTPPPGPAFSPPEETQEEPRITVSLTSPGGVTSLVQPQWPGHLPLIPPVPHTTLFFPGDLTQEGAAEPPLTVIVDAGAAAQTIQLHFTPLDVESLPSGWPGAQALQAFRLKAFDIKAVALDLQAARPIKLRLPVGSWTASGVQGRHLLMASLNEEQGTWQPLVTAYYSSEEVIESRLLSFSATLALFSDSP